MRVGPCFVPCRGFDEGYAAAARFVNSLRKKRVFCLGVRSVPAKVKSAWLYGVGAQDGDPIQKNLLPVAAPKGRES